MLVVAGFKELKSVKLGSAKSLSVDIQTDGCTLYLNFESLQEAKNFAEDLEYMINEEYASQFELLHDEY